MGRVSHFKHFLAYPSCKFCGAMFLSCLSSSSIVSQISQPRPTCVTNNFHVGMQMDINHHLQMHQSAELTTRKQIYFRSRRGKGSSLCLCMLDMLWVCQNPRTNFGLEFHVLCTSYKEFLSRHHTPCTISSLCRRLPTTQLSLGYDRQAIIIDWTNPLKQSLFTLYTFMLTKNDAVHYSCSYKSANHKDIPHERREEMTPMLPPP